MRRRNSLNQPVFIDKSKESSTSTSRTTNRMANAVIGARKSLQICAGAKGSRNIEQEKAEIKRSLV